MKRITAFILAVLLLSLSVISCAERAGYQKEENTGWNKDSYPFPIKSNTPTVNIMLKSGGQIIGDFNNQKHIIRIQLE